MSFDEISLTNRVLTLRESSADSSELIRSLHDDLSLEDSEAEALATVLADRFVSHEERVDLLSRMELRGVLSEGSSVGGFLERLAGIDGREATRYHARELAYGLTPRSSGGETDTVSSDAIRELAAALPRAGADFGAVSTITYGMYSYLARDSAMCSLAAEIRGNWENSSDPVLRMRSARVLAETGDVGAAAFLRESEASFDSPYSGPLGFDERIARAAGLAIDGNEAAARFLQNVAMNPLERVDRRSFAIDHLPPSSLDNGSDCAEVFRSLAEDPEEPVPTRYRMLSILARAPHPPETSWWEGILNDPTMTVSDRASSGEAAAGNAGNEYSVWNMAIAALGSSHAEFASNLLQHAIDNRGWPVYLRREALMAYIHQNGRGELSWDTLREVLALPSGEWDGILEEIELGDRPLRLHFAPSRGGDGGIASGERVDGEVVLELRHDPFGWRVTFRPLNRAHDARVPVSTPPAFESYLPLNRRISLGGIETEEISATILTATPTWTPASHSNTGTGPGAASGTVNVVGASETGSSAAGAGASTSPPSSSQRQNSGNAETRRGI